MGSFGHGHCSISHVWSIWSPLSMQSIYPRLSPNAQITNKPMAHRQKETYCISCLSSFLLSFTD